MIRGILKHGASFVAGYTLGYAAGKLGKDEATAEGNVWKGETRTITMDEPKASLVHDSVNAILDAEAYTDAPFAREDCIDVRRKLAHAISDYNEGNSDVIQIELTDRERLRMYESLLNQGLKP